MNISHAVFLGIIQGVTEFLPVSSSGHLSLFFAQWGHFQSSLAMEVALHAGTLGSIFLFFRKDIYKMFCCLCPGEAFSQNTDCVLERRRVWFVVIASLPTAVIGFGLKDIVGGLAASYLAVGCGFVLTCLFLIGGELSFHRAVKSLADIPWRHMIILGVVQGMAVWPGVSRSGATIAAALLLGWKWEEAGRMSFLMAIPAIVGATVLMAKDMSSIDFTTALAGVLVSFVIGCLSLWVLMKFLAAKKLWPFVLYCGLLAGYAFYKSLS